MSDQGTGSDGSGRGAASVRRSGRGLAAFSTLLALIALAFAGYPYFQRMVGSGAANDGLEALRALQQRQAEELSRLSADSAAFETRLAQQQIRIDEGIATDSQRSTSEPVGTPSSIPVRALNLAEAAFLLQGANDRLLVTRDTRAALAMLLAAQSLVDQVDDASLSDVRTELANEITALRDMSGVDVETTFAHLQTVLHALPDLPARGVRFVATQPSAPADAVPASAGTVAWQKFLSLFEFRRQGASARPPLGPDEATYLRLNLGLMIQTAELALLRNDDAIYQESLQGVRRWLDDYLDTGAQEVASVRTEIDQLLAVRLDRSVPDVGRSLAALRRILAPPAADAPIAATPSSENP